MGGKLSWMTQEQYEEVKSVVCPFCNANLPDILACEEGFYHFIEGDPIYRRFECLAGSLRRAYAATMANLAYRLDREWDIEEPDEETLDVEPIVIPAMFVDLEEYAECSDNLQAYLAIEFSGTSNAAVPVRAALRHNLFLLLDFAMGRKDMEHPWLLDRCNEVQASPDGHLDLWSREHYKSTIITLGRTIQDILRTHGRGALGQEACIGIFSHTRPIAKDFLRQIKTVLESNELLRRMFPDVLYYNARKESPRWADEAILVKRKNIRSEATVEAWGLVDSQPTSKHFTHRVYDDVVTDKSVSTEGQIEKTTRAVQMSDNLGAEGGVARFIGTTYAYKDTYSEIRKTGVITREYPGREGGTEDGAPVFRSEEWHVEKRRKQGPYVYSLSDPHQARAGGHAGV